MPRKATYSNEQFRQDVLSLVRVPNRTLQLLFQEIGRALWSIQFFEDALATYLVAVFHSSKAIGASNAYEILEHTRKSTAGTLLRKLREKGGLSRKADKLLSHIVDERNWLTHRLQHENGNDLYNHRKFLRLILRIQALSQDALAAQKEFGYLLGEWVKTHGYTESQLNEATIATVKASRQRARAR